MPLAVLESVTAERDAWTGRQRLPPAAQLDAVADAAPLLTAGAPVSLEDRPEDLAATVLKLCEALRAD